MNKKGARVMLEAAILVAVCAVASLFTNLIRPNGIDLIRKPDAPAFQGIRRVELEQAKKLYDEGRAVFVDSRSNSEYGAGHIAGSRNIPYELDEDQIVEAMKDLDFDAIIVAYCSGTDCNSSEMLAKKLLDLGYTQIHVFFAGWPAWTAAGYPVQSKLQRPLYSLGGE